MDTIRPSRTITLAGCVPAGRTTRSPQTMRSCMRVMMATIGRLSIPGQGGLDHAVRLFRGNEHFVAVLEAERRQVYGKMMLVRHHQPDLRDIGNRVEHALSH